MRLLLMCFLFVSINGFCQNLDKTIHVKLKAEKFFSKIDPAEFANLIPFYAKQKWGFMHSVTKTVAVVPMFDIPSFFNPELNAICDNISVHVYTDGMVTTEEQQISFLIPEIMREEPDPSKIRRFDDGIKGFSVSATGELLYYSDLYEYGKESSAESNIRIFKEGNNFYGIVRNNEGLIGIIDTSGVPVKGFEFKHQEIFVNEYVIDKFNTWLFVKEKDSEHYSVMNTKSEVRFHNEIFAYPFPHASTFGYAIYRLDNSYAIFDFYLLQWVVKPQTTLIIKSLNYSSVKTLDPTIPSQRSEANIYYLVEHGKEKNFVDLKGNVYKP